MRKISSLLILVAFLLQTVPFGAYDGEINLFENSSAFKGSTIIVTKDGTGDFTTIQAAIIAASPGQTIYVHAGIYNENIIIDKSLTILGEDKTTTVIQSLNSFPAIIIQSDNVTVSGLTVNSVSTGISVKGNNNDINDNIIDVYVHKFAQIAAGTGHTLGVKDDGTVWAWGSNRNGQLGDGTLASKNYPVQVRSPDGNSYLTDIIQVSAGNVFSVALSSNGTVWSWGSNNNGRLGIGSFGEMMDSNMLPQQVLGINGVGCLQNVTKINSGLLHMLALLENSTLVAWGSNIYGPLGDGTDIDRAVPVMVKNTQGTGVLTNITSMAGGFFHSLALDKEGNVFSWGDNRYGQLGYFASERRTLPGKVLISDNVSSISTKDHHSLALMEDGTVRSWGWNSYGQLGDGTRTQRTIPVQVRGGKSGTEYLQNITAVSAGSEFSMAIMSNGTVWTWGKNWYGQLGNGNLENNYRPVYVITEFGNLTDIIRISAGGSNSLALRNDGTVWMWGHNSYGIQDDGIIDNRYYAKLLKGDVASGYLNDVIAVVAQGLGHTLALKSDGTVWSWGRNNAGQLGVGNNVNINIPVQVKGENGTGYLEGIIAVYAGYSESFALRHDGTLFSWGSNWYGQLADGTTTPRNFPVRVVIPQELSSFIGLKKLESGIYHTTALMDDGTVWSWGTDSFGIIGQGYDGTELYTPMYMPVRVKSPDGEGYLTDIIDISASYEHSMAIMSNGTVWTWGKNWYGQLGGSTKDWESLPIQVKNSDGTGYLSGAIAVSGGYGHSLALMDDGTVWSWGRNDVGQLGDGTNEHRNLPVQVKNSDGTGYLSGAVAVFAGSHHSVILKDDNTFWSWGRNDVGQLGDGTMINSNKPISSNLIPSDIISFSTGFDSTIVLKNDGTVWTWGSNSYGQLGDGAIANRPYPSSVRLRQGSSGIELTNSSNENLITGNIISNYVHVVFIQDSQSNIVRYNNIENGRYGIVVYSSNNEIFHNNFINNSVHAENHGLNTWHYKSQGNYWSDYAGEDLTGDGTGDTSIPHYYLDHYPLMSISGWKHMGSPETPVIITRGHTSYSGTYNITWSRPAYGDIYVLYENGQEIYSGSNLYFNIKDKENGTYTYKVKAVNVNGTSLFSNEITVNVLITWPQIPSTPSFITGSQVSDTNYLIEWQSSGYAEYYVLYENNTEIYNGTNRQALITGRNEGTYIYRVMAGNENGTSGLSGQIAIVVRNEVEEDVDKSTPGFGLISILIAIAFIGLIKKKKC